MWNDSGDPPLIQPTETTTVSTNPVVVTNASGSNNKGKLIAALLGVLILIAGVAAGLFLVNQQQLVNQKAAIPTTAPPNLQTDNNNCGAIGNVCTAGKSCSGGICVSSVSVTPQSNALVACGQPCGAQTDGSVLSINCGVNGVCGNSANGGTTGNRCLPSPAPAGYVTNGGICANDPNPAVFCINHTDGTRVTTVGDLQTACNAAAAPVSSTSPTSSPTLSATATSSPTASPTSSAVAIATTATPTQQPIPVSGVSIPTILGIGVGLFLTLGGIILIL